MSNNSNITVTVGEADRFKFHQPRPEGVWAVKVTEKNIRQLAAQIGESLNEEVLAAPDYIGLPPKSQVDGRFTNRIVIGDWVIRDYNYALGVDVYHVADVAERRQYDLR